MAEAPDFAARRAALAPRDPAFHDHATGRSWRFDQISDEADRLAAAFRAAGLQPGDRAGVLAFNRVELFVALFAARRAGVILCPLNWRAPVAELAPLAAATGLALMLHDTAHAGAAAALAPALPRIAMADDGGFGLPPAPPAPVAAVGEDDPWYLLFTSGTTGRPRAVIQTARMALAVAVNLAQAMALTSADRSVSCLPMFHTAGINLFALPLFLWGGMSHVLPRFDADRLVALLAAGEVTHLFAVPTTWQALADHPRLDAAALGRLRGIASGGAALPEALARRLAARGAVLRNGFGMTETGPTGLLNDAASAARWPGAVGRPQLMTEARLAGVPDGQPGTGELLLRGATVTPGYFGDPAATAAAYTPDGWLQSGDVARRDAEGLYWIEDRLKDMFVSGGENVWPAEVERVLADHPDIAEAAVVGRPDPQWGETGHAFVVARDGRTPDLGGLPRWCRVRLAAYKVPRVFRLVADLPRTPSGKVRKDVLREGAWT
jgi:fatty-acyl-CoA synthase